MDVSFLVAVSLFLLFTSIVLVATINYFIRVPESATIIELRSKTKNLFDIFFGSGGVSTSERVTVDLYRIPLSLEETNGTARTNEVVAVSVDFDDVCDKEISWNNTVRVYDQQFNELPSKISYQEFCSSQYLNRSVVTFVTNISANKKERVYVYSLNNSNTTAPNHDVIVKGYWTFDEAGGTLAKDFSGSQNNGTLTNFDFNSLSGWFNGTSCKYGSCLKFDGSNDYVNVSDSSSFNLINGFTLVAWVNASQLADNGGIIVKGTGSAASTLFQLETMANGRVFIYVYDNTQATWIGRQTSASAISTNAWYHIVATWDGTTGSTGLDIFVNGVVKDAGDANSGAISSVTGNTNPVTIGARTSGTYPFNGTIDDARIYNRVLTTDEIKSIVNATLLTVSSFPAESVTAVSAVKVQELSGRSYQEIKSLLGGDFDFRIEIREKR